MAKRKKKPAPTKLTTLEKKQLRKILSKIRRFPRKKKSTTTSSTSSFNIDTLRGLVTQYKATKQQFDAASKRSDLFKTPSGIATFQKFSDAFTAATNNVITYVQTFKVAQSVLTNLGYP